MNMLSHMKLRSQTDLTNYVNASRLVTLVIF